MKILVLAGDVWHPAAVVKTGLAPFENTHPLNITFEWASSFDEPLRARIDEFALIILAKANHQSEQSKTPWVNHENEKAVDAYVQSGGGLLVIHAGTARYRETQFIRKLTGGIFLQHPDKCPVTVTFIQNDFLTEGCHAFTLNDEHYFMQLDDDSVEVFLTTESEHGRQPAGWLKEAGKGRVCVITPGHYADVWLQESMQRLISNALVWCSGEVVDEI